LNNQQKAFLIQLGIILFCLVNMLLLIQAIVTQNNIYGMFSLGFVTLTLFSIYKSLGDK
jgi:hypothetical protein